MDETRAERVTFSATVDERGKIRFDNRNETLGRLARFVPKVDRRVTVTVSRYVKPKSNPQLGLYFASEGILECWAAFCGYDRDEMHRELKLAYLKPQLVISRLTGEEVNEIPSLADLNAEEMSAFLDRVIREGQQLGIRFRLERAS